MRDDRAGINELKRRDFMRAGLVGFDTHETELNGHNDLGDLDDTSNLKYTVDFRSVYQEILNTHLGADAQEILGKAFDRVRSSRRRPGFESLPSWALTTGAVCLAPL